VLQPEPPAAGAAPETVVIPSRTPAVAVKRSDEGAGT